MKIRRKLNHLSSLRNMSSKLIVHVVKVGKLTNYKTLYFYTRANRRSTSWCNSRTRYHKNYLKKLRMTPFSNWSFRQLINFQLTLTSRFTFVNSKPTKGPKNLIWANSSTTKTTSYFQNYYSSHHKHEGSKKFPREALPSIGHFIV